jgi:DNA-directed RNA polymerase specialized sigma24 family protein
MAEHYVDNAKLVAELEAYKARLALNPEERLPEYVGKCVLDICKRFSMRPNFIGYSYRDEMVSDAIENVLQYITNFDSKKSTNAFSYITQIAYYAFIRRISREKKQSYIKHCMIRDMPMDSFDSNDFDDAELSQNFVSYIQSHSSFDFEAFEKKIEKKKPVVKSPLDEFMKGEE